MIASFTNNFIFLRTRKTGGTSVEVVLSGWCSEPDVCTWINPDEEVFRKEYGGLRPLRGYKSQRVYHHMHARDVRKIFGEFWDSAYKFCIERHPYEKVVSRVFWNISRTGRDFVRDFDAELESVLASEIFIDRDVYAIDGKISVDEVIMFPDVWARLEELGQRWGKKLPAEIPRLKSEHRKDRRPAHEILSLRHRERIQSLAEFEFAHFAFER